MKKIIKIVQNKDAPFNVTWLINNICPNSCSYCPPDLHKGKNHHYDWENARTFFKILFEKFGKVHCSVAGGEPSVSPFFRELVQIFHENNSTIGITSNAAKPVDFWKEVSPYLNYICFSWHPEFVDSKFEDKVKASAENTLVTVRVMMHPEYWKESLSAYEKYDALPYIDCEAVRILDWMHDNNGVHSKYTKEQQEWFSNYLQKKPTKKSKKNYTNIKILKLECDFHFDDGSKIVSATPVNFINAGMTNFFGYKCNIGQQEVFVDWRGYIRPGNCDVGGWIGNINDPYNIKWPTDSYTCNKNICHCATDVLIDKHTP